MFNQILVIIGIVILGYSLYLHVRFLGLVKQTLLGKWWAMLLVLVLFFALGYIVFAYWLAVGPETININFLKTLVSFILFFGAVFVVITISLISSTIRDLIREKEETKRLQAERITLLQNKEEELEKKIQEKTRNLEEIKASLEKRVKEQTANLEKKIVELEQRNEQMFGREVRMVELKKEIEQLKKKLG